MTILATCGHKAEWIDPICGRCPNCCLCDEEATPVHINSKAAAIALAAYARRTRSAIVDGKEKDLTVKGKKVLF